MKEELLRSGAKMCPFDNSLFVWYNEGRLEGIICTYVEDFLWTGTENFETNIIQGIRSKFLIGSSGSSMFKYVGLNVISKNDSIVVDQFHYSSSLSPAKISHTRAMQKTCGLSDHEKSEYRALVGQLNWLATHTRPDIAYDTCELSVCFNKATVGDLLRLNKLVERVTRDGLRLRFSRLNSLETCITECYTDAAFANLPGGGSQGAFIIFLMDSSGKRCPIFWQTRKLRRIVKSTLSAEIMALLEGAEASVYIVKIIGSIILKPGLKVNCYVDNKSLVDALSSTKRVEDRRLRIDLAVLEDMLAKKEISSVSWIASHQQLADCLTKRGVSTERLRAVISED